MRYSRGVWILFLFISLSPDLAQGGDFNKNIPLKTVELSDYNGEQIYVAAYQAYVCSFLMTQAGQMEKGQLLRGFSVELMQQKRVKELGKNWNDVNFPGALSAFIMSDGYSKRFNVSQSIAATRLLEEDPECKILNKITEGLFKKRDGRQ